MTEEEYKLKKLELEIIELEKPNWKKPTYLTLIISASTVIISATIGFSQYFTKVNKENALRVEELEKKLAENKDQQHKMEIATLNYETLLAKSKNDEITKNNLVLQQEILKKQRELSITESDIKKKQFDLNKTELKLKTIEKDYSSFKNLVINTIEKYKAYNPGYANGAINSTSGQLKIKEIMEINDTDKQRIEIGKFAFGITNQTTLASTDKILRDIGIE